MGTMAVSPSQPPPPPGWYPDPRGQGQRYWDGNDWTDHWAPPPAPVAVAAAPSPPATTGDWIGGILLSLLFPLIGLIVGIVYATKSGSTKQQVGVMCIVLSLLAGTVLLAAVSSSGSGY
jgi:hypothetical protein